MLFVLVKRSLITAHASHFAGGKHAFLCLAEALAAEGEDRMYLPPAGLIHRVDIPSGCSVSY